MYRHTSKLVVETVSTSWKRFASVMTNPARFEGKVAIVTASTEGIGFGIARRLAKDGCKVMISSRKEANVAKALESLAEEGLGDRVEGVTCHVGLAKDRENLIQATVEKMGGIDFLVSNAAVNPTFGPALQCTEDQWDKIFDTNVKAAFLLTQSAVPHLLKRKDGGSVVFISSIGGLNPIPMIGPYSVSKTALLGLTKTLSFELGPQNVRVNCVAPGIIRTKFASALTENDDIAEKILETMHIKRFGVPDDIAGLVAFLCSEDSAFITGETFVAAGGAQSRL